MCILQNTEIYPLSGSCITISFTSWNNLFPGGYISIFSKNHRIADSIYISWMREIWLRSNEYDLRNQDPPILGYPVICFIFITIVYFTLKYYVLFLYSKCINSFITAKCFMTFYQSNWYLIAISGNMFCYHGQR